MCVVWCVLVCVFVWLIDVVCACCVLCVLCCVLCFVCRVSCVVFRVLCVVCCVFVVCVSVCVCVCVCVCVGSLPLGTQCEGEDAFRSHFGSSEFARLHFLCHSVALACHEAPSLQRMCYLGESPTQGLARGQAPLSASADVALQVA